MVNFKNSRKFEQKSSCHAIQNFLNKGEDYGKAYKSGRSKVITERKRCAIVGFASNSARQIAQEADVNSNVRNVTVC